MARTVLIIGSQGQLGQSLGKIACHYPDLNLTFVGRDQLDLSPPKQIADFFEAHSYSYIINAAAYTAVDRAESEPELAEQINHHAVAQLAEIAKQSGSILLHVSTDYVFDGTNHQPYHEGNDTNPQSIYGGSKLRGEQAMKKIDPQGCIVRTGWLYSEFGHNFVKTMLRLTQERKQISVVSDQVGTPTYATDLAHALLTMVERMSNTPSFERGGAGVEIYHYANEGVASWYDFAKAIFEYANQRCSLIPIETAQYPTPAKRPHYSVLNKTKIKKQFELKISHWRDALKYCIEEVQR